MEMEAPGQQCGTQRKKDLLLNMAQMFLTAILSQFARWQTKLMFEECAGHHVQGSHLTEHQQVLTLPGCFSHSPSRHSLYFATGVA